VKTSSTKIMVFYTKKIFINSNKLFIASIKAKTCELCKLYKSYN